MAEAATLQAWVKERDGITEHGAKTQIPGGLKEVFEHLAQIDWSDYPIVLFTVQSCGYIVEFEDGMQMMVTLKQKED